MKKPITVEERARQLSDRLWHLEQAAKIHTERRDEYSRHELVSEAVKFTNLVRLISGSR